ncbi:hypothetical protein TNCV_1676201 [Trichonephila clavipes]|nr:hypothetical protein TNCV_1676201 [Trichonephila clavipes]
MCASVRSLLDEFQTDQIREEPDEIRHTNHSTETELEKSHERETTARSLAVRFGVKEWEWNIVDLVPSCAVVSMGLKIPRPSKNMSGITIIRIMILLRSNRGSRPKPSPSLKTSLATTFMFPTP